MLLPHVDVELVGGQGDDVADGNWEYDSTRGEVHSTGRCPYAPRQTRLQEANEDFEVREMGNLDEWCYQDCEVLVSWVVPPEEQPSQGTNPKKLK